MKGIPHTSPRVPLPQIPMKNPTYGEPGPRPDSRNTWHSTFAPLALAAVVGSVTIEAAHSLMNRPGLAAAPVVQSGTDWEEPTLGADTDGDGLADALELFIRTNPREADSDGDRITDTEEIARRSSPRIRADSPEDSHLSLGIRVYGYRQQIHVLTSMYIRGGDLDDVNFHMGGLLGETLIEFPDNYDRADLQVNVMPAHDPRDLLVLIDMPLDITHITQLGNVSIYAAAGRVTTGLVETADVVDLFVTEDGSIAERRDYEPQVFFATTTSATQTTTQGQGSGSPASGSVYVPVPVSGESNSTVPSSWTPGQICVQRSTSIGASGAVQTREVVESGCEDNWDSYCDPGCSGSVGSTYRVLDPVVLAGG
jgi:hypothetical protein